MLMPGETGSQKRKPKLMKLLKSEPMRRVHSSTEVGIIKSSEQTAKTNVL